MLSENCCETRLLTGTDGVPSLDIRELPEANLEANTWQELTAGDSNHIQFTQTVRQRARNVLSCGCPVKCGTNETDRSLRVGNSECRDGYCMKKECQPSEIPTAECHSENAKNISLAFDCPADVCQTSREKPQDMDSVPCHLNEVNEEPYTLADKTSAFWTAADVGRKVLSSKLEHCRQNSETTGVECIVSQTNSNTGVKQDACSNWDSLSDISTNINDVTNHHQCESDDSEGSGQDYCIDCCDVVFKDGIEYRAYGAEHHMNEIMELIGRDLSEPYSIYTYRYFIYNWPHLCIRAMDVERCIGAIVCKMHVYQDSVIRGYIAMLAVDKEYRRRGIGTQLVLFAIKAMIDDDCDEILLEAETDNVAALRLYENLGFIRERRLFRYYLNGQDAFRLQLLLD